MTSLEVDVKARAGRMDHEIDMQQLRESSRAIEEVWRRFEADPCPDKAIETIRAVAQNEEAPPRNSLGALLHVAKTIVSSHYSDADLHRIRECVERELEREPARVATGGYVHRPSPTIWDRYRG